jgi:hypothetical protein
MVPNLYPDHQNAFGLKRAPWNQNHLDTISRVDNLYGQRTYLQWSNLQDRQTCLSLPTYAAFNRCRDLLAHTTPHIVGGAENSEVINITTAFPGSPHLQFALVGMRAVFAAPLLFSGVSVCPESCDPTNVYYYDISSCFCGCNPDMTPMQIGLATAFATQFGLPAPIDLDPTSSENVCVIGGWVGDLADASTSPGDPCFMFLHSDVDRALAYWQIDHISLGTDCGVEAVGFCPGHGLNDPVGGGHWTAREVGLGTETTPMTIKMIIERTLPAEYGQEMILAYRWEPYSAWEGAVLEEPNFRYPDLPPDIWCAGASQLSYLFVAVVVALVGFLL